MLLFSRRAFGIMDRVRRLRGPTLIEKVTTDLEESYQPSPDSSNSFTCRSFNYSYKPYSSEPVPTEARAVCFPSFEQPLNSRSLRVALLGPPNAGKSSLMNAFLQKPIASVSAKAHTTREEIRGVYTVGDSQVVFVDCPGVLPVRKTEELKALVSVAWQAAANCDVCLLVLDTLKRPDPEIVNLLRKVAKKPLIGVSASDPDHSVPPIILVLNKIDKIKEPKWLHRRQAEIRQHAEFSRIFYTSAVQGKGVSSLLNHLISLAKPKPWIYPSEISSSLSKTEQVEQVVRSFLYTWFNKDVPYKIKQETVGWSELDDGSILVEQQLTVADSVVARMVMGIRNRMVNQISMKAAERLSDIWKKEVKVKIWVRALKTRKSRFDNEKELERSFGNNGFKL